MYEKFFVSSYFFFEKDTTSLDVPKQDYVEALKNDVKGLKIGIPKEFFAEGLNDEVRASLENSGQFNLPTFIIYK